MNIKEKYAAKFDETEIGDKVFEFYALDEYLFDKEKQEFKIYTVTGKYISEERDDYTKKFYLNHCNWTRRQGEVCKAENLLDFIDEYIPYKKEQLDKNKEELLKALK